MYPENRILFTILLLGCAWQDIRKRTVPAWLCAVVGILAIAIGLVYRSQWGIREAVCGISVGLGILGVHFMTQGAVGDGDGWFFVVAGLLLGFWQNLTLLFYGLLCCCMAGCAAAGWSRLSGKGWRVRRIRLPFIPFLLPIGIWLILR